MPVPRRAGHPTGFFSPQGEAPAVDRRQHSGGAGDAGFTGIADGTSDEAEGNTVSSFTER